MKFKFRFTTTRTIAVGFLLVIALGTLLLMLPVSTVEGQVTSLIDALFTATTSVCVTGLVVCDTFAHWTLFGKLVILVLIQVGGLGVVSITSLLMLLFRRKFSLKNTLLMQDAYNLNTKQGLKKFTLRVFQGTILIEGIGALIYMIPFCKEFGSKGIWYSIFNSISAFCNAGIDIIGPNSLMDYSSNPLVLINTAFLIILGGIGFVVWWDFVDIIKRLKNKKLAIHSVWASMQIQTKLVLIMTSLLLISGTFIIYYLERYNPNTLGNMSQGDKILNSFFQAVTFRTAGFASISQKGLSESSAIVGMVYMFVGGSPAGTAGGVKTVTLAVIFLTFLSLIKERDEIVVFKKKISDTSVKKAVSIVFVNLSFMVIFSVLLFVTNHVDVVDGLYEVFSALATVGLTRDLTSTLNFAGKIIIILCMFFGRVGPISMVVAFNSQDSRKNLIRYPEEEIIVG